MTNHIPALDLAAVAPRPPAPQAELASGSRAAAVKLVDVAKSFHTRCVLRQVDLSIEPQEFVALVGRSGCGKSTLLRLIAGLIPPTSGRVYIDGQPLAGINPRARMMFQDARLLPWVRVADNVALAARDQPAVAVEQALQMVQLADRGQDWPLTLSGGQRQRVALARALIGRPPLLLLDEPLGALDALTRIEMQLLIDRLWQQHPCTAVLVTHDIEEAVLLANRILIVEDGTISKEFAVDLPRPRARLQPAFQQLVAHVLTHVLRTSVTASETPGPPMDRDIARGSR